MPLTILVSIFFMGISIPAWASDVENFLATEIEETQQESVEVQKDIQEGNIPEDEVEKNTAPKTFKQKTGPGIGTHIPHDLSSIDHEGREQNIETLQGERGITLMFVRSADWCPFCQQQLLDANDYAAAFEEAGYPLVALSYDAVDILKNFHKKYDLSFTMISDKSSDIIKAFGVLNEDQGSESSFYGIPHPGIFIIDSEKVVLGKFFMSDYTQRVSTQEVLKAVQDISDF